MCRINTIGCNITYLGKSKYKYVSKIQINARFGLKDKPPIIAYRVRVPKLNWNCCFDNEREAAKAVDLKFIEMGEEPRNILKRT